MPDFGSIEEIDKHYDRQVKAAETDEAKRDLEIERREQKADYRERQATRRELEAHRRETISRLGIPDGLADFVTGTTPEEIDAAAEKLSAAVKANGVSGGGGGGAPPEPSAADLYGRSSAGGGQQPPPREDPVFAWAKDFEERYNAKDPLKPISTSEVTRYVRWKLGQHAAAGLAENSRSQSMRDAARNLKQQGVVR
jgi:hypothetical protein